MLRVFSSSEEFQAISDFLQAEVERNSEIEVILRADAATEYQYVQPVMEAITNAGISRVNLMGMQLPSLLAVIGFFAGGLVVTFFVLPFVL